LGFLDNLFGKLKKQDLKSEKENSIEKTKVIDLSKVYPRIKGLYDDENPEPFPKSSNELSVSLDDSPVFKRLAKGIGVFYMLDEGDKYQIIQNRHLSEDLTIEKLHSAALTNMAIAISDKTEVNGDPSNIMMVTNGGNFEATMLLADFLWDQIKPVFNDNICVAIPANDLLFITSKNNSKARENLRNLVRQYFENSETKGLIVKYIYERINGEWFFVESA
jgi:uncharacterized protein YtpQ (UPF0354 family)